LAQKLKKSEGEKAEKAHQDQSQRPVGKLERAGRKRAEDSGSAMTEKTVKHPGLNSLEV
jgi:hypothetical protein